MARIAHLDADAFYVSVHLRHDPSLRGKPVVVAGSGPRSVVTTASYEARRFGIHSAGSAAAARVACPHAVFIKPDFPMYRAASAEMWEIVRGYLGELEHVGLDEGYADVSGLERPVSTLREVVQAVKEQTTLQLSVGLGPNRRVAKVASDCDKPAGFTVLSREQACERFADADPKLIPGIGPKTRDRLRELGITTLAKLREAPDELLATRFTQRGVRELKESAAFHGSTIVQTNRPRKSRSAEETFDTDIELMDEMLVELVPLARKVAEDLKRREAAGATIGIKVRTDDFATYTRDRTIGHPTNDEQEILDVARELLQANPPQRPVRLLGVRVGGLDAGEPDDDTDQLTLFA